MRLVTHGAPIDGTEHDWLAHAEQNDAEGQLYLGLSYVKGEGVAEDLVEAYKWLLLAARQGDESAKKIVTNPLESSLRPEQIAEGQKRARDFKPR